MISSDSKVYSTPESEVISVQKDLIICQSEPGAGSIESITYENW